MRSFKVPGRIPVCVLLFCAVVLSALACAAQTAGSMPQPRRARILPAFRIRSPFDMNAPASRRVTSITFLAPQSISAPDREIIAAALSRVRGKSALLGFDLDRRNWTYRQMLCPIFPRHILLLYERNASPGEVSKFVAVISARGGNGAVRIVPILRRSYSLYTPAPSNALTIAVFNHLLAQENSANSILSGHSLHSGHSGASPQKVDWLTAGLCYAALAGRQVVLPPPVGAQTQNSGNFSLAMNPLLQVGDQGQASVEFLDVEDPRRPVEWDINFAASGKLRSVALTPLPAMQPTAIPPVKQIP